VILISGGGRGLGRLLAHQLSRAGAAVAILARSGDELSRTVRELDAAGARAAAAVADVSRPQPLTGALRHFRQRLGPVDVLVNNAGIWGPVAVTWEVDETEWWRTFEVNVGGAFALTRAVLPDMITAGQGRIINLTSYAGVYRWPLCSAYAASKSALVNLTNSLAAETRPHGVSVFSVDPGLLPIGMTGVPLGAQVNPDSAEGSAFD
jgi:NAD(P)-dependent dehydrogenase (short-subunit alcohol dehydrogenase family)